MRYPGTILKTWNIDVKKQMGQNFLTDSSMAKKIVLCSKINKDDTVIEIGPGLGALTIDIAMAANEVYAIEKDKRLLSVLQNELIIAKVNNVKVINSDILKIDIASFFKGKKIVVIGNLPYNISSQILVRSIAMRTMIKNAVFMFQKELAQRIEAPPGSKMYGRLSAVLQYCADIHTVVEVKNNLFYPKPKVDSRVIEIKFKDKIDFPADDELLLFAVIKAAFSARRKTLKNAFAKSELKLTNDVILKIFSCAKIDFNRRAETLSVNEFTKLSNCMGMITKGSYRK